MCPSLGEHACSNTAIDCNVRRLISRDIRRRNLRVNPRVFLAHESHRDDTYNRVRCSIFAEIVGRTVVETATGRETMQVVCRGRNEISRSANTSCRQTTAELLTEVGGCLLDDTGSLGIAGNRSADPLFFSRDTCTRAAVSWTHAHADPILFRSPLFLSPRTSSRFRPCDANAY